MLDKNKENSEINNYNSFCSRGLMPMVCEREYACECTSVEYLRVYVDEC